MDVDAEKMAYTTEEKKAPQAVKWSCTIERIAVNANGDLLSTLMIDLGLSPFNNHWAFISFTIEVGFLWPKTNWASSLIKYYYVILKDEGYMGVEKN